MPNTDARSHSGCWTCRARRKKCDEAALPCTICAGLSLTCYGYGTKPAWLDGGPLEKAKVIEFKAAVKQNLRLRRRSRVLPMSDTIPVGSPVASAHSSVPETPLRLQMPGSPPGLQSLLPFPSPLSPVSDFQQFQTAASPFFDFNFGALQHESSAPTDSAVDLTDFVRFDDPGLAGRTEGNSYTPFGVDLSSPPAGQQQIGRPLIQIGNVNECQSIGQAITESYSPFQPELGGTAQCLLSADAVRKDVVHQYMRRVFPSQFPLADDTVRGEVASQLLAFAARSQPCLASLGLHGLNESSSTFGGFCSGPADAARQQATNYMETARRHLEDVATKNLFATGSEAASFDDTENVEAQMCAVQIIFSCIMRRDSSWPHHLAWLSSMPVIDYTKGLDKCGMHLHILQSLLVTLDIFASTSATHSHFARKYFDHSAYRNNDLQAVLGCSSGVMRIILSISELQAWKQQQTSAGSLSLMELVQRGMQLQTELDQARDPSSDRPDDHRAQDVRVITKTFAAAASAYLHSTISGAHPEIPEVKKGVADTIDALQSMLNAEMVKSFTWPICIAACLAEGDHRRAFEKLEQGITDEFGKNQRVLRAFAVARECWRLREKNGVGPGCRPYDWKDGMASLGEMLLLF